MNGQIIDLDDAPEGTVVRSGALFYRKHGDVWRLLVMSGSSSHQYARPAGADQAWTPRGDELAVAPWEDVPLFPEEQAGARVSPLVPRGTPS